MAISNKIKTVIKEELVQLRLEKDKIEKEISRLVEILDSIESESDEKIIKERRSQSFADYPKNGSFLEKLRYFEEVDGKMWKSEDMKKNIQDAEGEDFKYFSQNLQYLIGKKEVVCAKFNNSRINSFFTARPDDVLEVNQKNRSVKIKAGHEPKALEKLNDEQKNPKNIAWSGI